MTSAARKQKKRRAKKRINVRAGPRRRGQMLFKQAPMFSFREKPKGEFAAHVFWLIFLRMESAELDAFPRITQWQMPKLKKIYRGATASDFHGLPFARQISEGLNPSLKRTAYENPLCAEYVKYFFLKKHGDCRGHGHGYYKPPVPLFGKLFDKPHPDNRARKYKGDSDRVHCDRPEAYVVPHKNLDGKL